MYEFVDGPVCGLHINGRHMGTGACSGTQWCFSFSRFVCREVSALVAV